MQSLQLEEESKAIQQQIEDNQVAKKYKGLLTVTKDDIIDVVSEMTGEPISKVMSAPGSPRNVLKPISCTDVSAELGSFGRKRKLT